MSRALRLTCEALASESHGRSARARILAVWAAAGEVARLLDKDSGRVILMKTVERDLRRLRAPKAMHATPRDAGPQILEGFQKLQRRILRT